MNATKFLLRCACQVTASCVLVWIYHAWFNITPHGFWHSLFSGFVLAFFAVGVTHVWDFAKKL